MSQSDICKFRLLDCLLITHFQVGHIFFRPRLCEVIFEYIDLYMHASLFLYFEYNLWHAGYIVWMLWRGMPQRRFPLICRKAGLSALKRAITATLMLFGNSNQFQYASSFNIYHKHWPSLSHALLFEENITCRNNSRRLFGCKIPVWPCIRMHLCQDQWD